MQSAVLTKPISVSQGYDALPKQEDNYVDKSRTRWLFSPFASIDLSDRITGHAKIEAGTFNKITNQGYRRHQTLPMVGNIPDFTSVLDGKKTGFTREEKTALDIAKEIKDSYSENGVVILEGLAGVDDNATINLMQQVLFGDGELPFALDTRLGDDDLVPVLTVWMNRLNDAGRANVNALSGDVRRTAERTHSELRAGLAQAIRYATETIEKAKGALALGQLKRRFNRVERRCFLALGEEIPNDLPMSTQNSGQNLVRELGEAFAQTLKASQTDNGIAELKNELLAGLAEVRQMKAELEKPQAEELKTEEAEKTRCQFIKGDNVQCKSFALKGENFCGTHKQKETE